MQIFRYTCLLRSKLIFGTRNYYNLHGEFLKIIDDFQFVVMKKWQIQEAISQILDHEMLLCLDISNVRKSNFHMPSGIIKAISQLFIINTPTLVTD